MLQLQSIYKPVVPRRDRKYGKYYVESYDCSICGSQNVLSKPIDVDSIEMTRSIYEVEASEQ